LRLTCNYIHCIYETVYKLYAEIYHIYFIAFVDVSTTAAGFLGTTVRQESLRQTVVPRKAATVVETSRIK